MHWGVVLARLISSANQGWVDDYDSAAPVRRSTAPAVATGTLAAFTESPLTAAPLEAPGRRWGPGNIFATGASPGTDVLLSRRGASFGRCRRGD